MSPSPSTVDPAPSPWPLLPPATLGVLGGGQLGLMFVLAAQSMGYKTLVFDPDPSSPAAAVAHHSICAEYSDAQALEQFAQLAGAITTEFENVPASALAQLAQLRPVSPSHQALSIAQDRASEKALFARLSIGGGCVPPAPHALIESQEDLRAVPQSLLPGILKTARLGYDGKGQIPVANRAELSRAWERLSLARCVLEQRLALAGECSVIVARGRGGQCVWLPVQRNVHERGILALTEVTAMVTAGGSEQGRGVGSMGVRDGGGGGGGVGADIAAHCVQAAVRIAHGLDYVGVLCVEFFILQDGSLIVNEMAPRPHNSGHYSIDACDTSQFELQVRTLAGLPLTEPRQHSAAVMLNLMGDLWFAGPPAGGGRSEPQPQTPPWEKILALPGAHLHLYGKHQARPGRKMGHLTLTGAEGKTARQAARSAASILGLGPTVMGALS